MNIDALIQFIHIYDDVKNVSSIAKRKEYAYIMDLTSFLPINAKIRQRLYHVLNDIWVIPTCKMCTQFTTWYNDQYRLYCSAKCSNKDPDKVQKIKSTNRFRYGCETPLAHNDEIRQKKETTLIARYGVKHYPQSRDMQTKTRQTVLKKYGVEYITQNEEIKFKIKQTNNIKYGGNAPINSQDVQNKIKETNIRKYGMSYAGHSPDSKQKRVSTNIRKFDCPTYTGSESHKVLLKNKYNDNDTRLFNNIPQYAITLLKDKDWLYYQHNDNKLTLTEIANYLSVDISTVAKYFKKHGLPVIALFNKSIAEQEITTFLSSFGISVINNIRTIIPPYELDLYIPSHNLAIEYCGLYWHNEQNKPNDYHRIKYDLCKKSGIRLITLFEDEWIYRKNLVKTKLQYLINKIPNKCFARKCSIKLIDSNTKTAFFDENHIQGDGPSSINIGLLYGTDLIACMGFIRMKQRRYVLSRYATSTTVVGGFTKLLAYFEDIYTPHEIHTFADLRWSRGDLYINTGFRVEKELPIDYFYVMGDTRCHKFNFRHRRLAKILNNYSSALSEHKNCLNNGIYRIYDCGKLKFIKNGKRNE